jgi:hypothetical protein
MSIDKIKYNYDEALQISSLHIESQPDMPKDLEDAMFFFSLIFK